MRLLAPLFLLCLLSPALVLAEDGPQPFQKMKKEDQWTGVSRLSRTLPMNWGAGGGINYGAEVPVVEGCEPDRSPRRTQPHDAASPSTGYCLGVCIHRGNILADVLQGKVVPPAPRRVIENLHENAGRMEFARVDAWMKTNGVANYDRALELHAVTMRQLLNYAINNPGSWVGLKSRAIHHAVQVFEMGGALVIIDPNVPEPMFGTFNPNGTFVWATANGRLSATVDFVYLPSAFWK